MKKGIVLYAKYDSFGWYDIYYGEKSRYPKMSVCAEEAELALPSIASLNGTGKRFAFRLVPVLNPAHKHTKR